MPYIGIYAVEADLPTLFGLLDDEVAFIVSDGPDRWRASRTLNGVDAHEVTLWHIPSGPLPLLGETKSSPDGVVSDPWAGWTERRAGADRYQPYFGTGHPSVIRLKVAPSGREPSSICGRSGFEWIGNHYAVLGSRAAKPTELWWKRLRRKVSQVGRKVPYGNDPDMAAHTLWALPAAYELLAQGAKADLNP